VRTHLKFFRFYLSLSVISKLVNGTEIMAFLVKLIEIINIYQ